MADTTTANYSFVKPEVGASVDTWGTKLNADLDSIDTQINTVTTTLLATKHAAFNVAQVSNSTRARYNNIAGFQTILTGNYTKQSATSNLLIRIGVVLFSEASPTGAGANGMKVTFAAGGAQSISGVCSSGNNAGFGSTCTAEKLFTGLPAGLFAWTFSVGRYDATNWYGTVNPNTTDHASLPPDTTTYVTFQESEP